MSVSSGHAMSDKSLECEVAVSRSLVKVAVGLLRQGYDHKLLTRDDLRRFSDDSKWSNPFQFNSKNVNGLYFFKGFRRVLPVLSPHDIREAQIALRGILSKLEKEGEQVDEAREATSIIFGNPHIARTFDFASARAVHLGMMRFRAVHEVVEGRPVFVIDFEAVDGVRPRVEMLFDPFHLDPAQQMIEIRSGESLVGKQLLVTFKLKGKPYLYAIGENFLYDLERREVVRAEDHINPIDVEREALDQAIAVESKTGLQLVLMERKEKSRMRIHALEKGDSTPSFEGPPVASLRYSKVGKRHLLTYRLGSDEWLRIFDIDTRTPLEPRRIDYTASAHHDALAFYEGKDGIRLLRSNGFNGVHTLADGPLEGKSLENVLVNVIDYTNRITTFRTYEGLHYLVDGRTKISVGSLEGGRSYEFPIERSEPRYSKVIQYHGDAYLFRDLSSGEIQIFNLVSGAPIATYNTRGESEVSAIFTYKDRVYGFFTKPNKSPFLLEFTYLPEH